MNASTVATLISTNGLNIKSMIQIKDLAPVFAEPASEAAHSVPGAGPTQHPSKAEPGGLYQSRTVPDRSGLPAAPNEGSDALDQGSV